MSATRPPAFDDRFTTPIEASRRGAHRARPKPASATLPVLAGIAVVLLVIGGIYAVLNGTDSSSGVSAAETGTSPSATAGAAPNTTTQPAAQPPATADSTSAASTGDTAVDHNVTLAVLNSISVQGLAKKVKTRLEGKDWTVTRTGNSKNKNLPTSKIYYAKTSLKSTAEAMVQDLGYGEIVKDSVVAKGGLVVVLGQDAA